MLSDTRKRIWTHYKGTQSTIVGLSMEIDRFLDLDAARRLNIDLDVQKFDTVDKNAQRQLETHMESVMPCMYSTEKLRKEDIEECNVEQPGETFCRNTAGSGPHAPKKGTHQIQFMLTRLMLTNLRDVA